MPKSTKTETPCRRKPAAQLTEAEWEIMKVVWEKEPCAVGTVQELLGHNDVKTTMIYTHVLNRGPAGVRSPVDAL